MRIYIPEIQITNLLNEADIFVKYVYAFNYDSFTNDFEQAMKH